MASRPESLKYKRNCEICGKQFSAYPSDRIRTCSQSCKNRLPRKNRKSADWSRIRQAWRGMKARCLKGGTPLGEKYYFGKVKVCREWMDFSSFYEWAISNGYSPTLEIDRIDPRGNYEPSNCRWATHTQQSHNFSKRKNARTSVFKGVSRHSSNCPWVAQIHENKKTFNLGSFKTELQAALAYDKEAYKRRGEFARVNFPERLAIRPRAA